MSPVEELFDDPDFANAPPALTEPAAAEPTGGAPAAAEPAAIEPAAPAQARAVDLVTEPPGAEIYLDLELVGTTPAVLEPTQPTEYRLERDGYQPRVVVVRPGVAMPVIRLVSEIRELDPEPPAQPAASAEATEMTSRTGSRRSRTRRRTMRARARTTTPEEMQSAPMRASMSADPYARF